MVGGSKLVESLQISVAHACQWSRTIVGSYNFECSTKGTIKSCVVLPVRCMSGDVVGFEQAHRIGLRCLELL